MVASVHLSHCYVVLCPLKEATSLFLVHWTLSLNSIISFFQFASFHFQLMQQNLPQRHPEIDKDLDEMLDNCPPLTFFQNTIKLFYVKAKNPHLSASVLATTYHGEDYIEGLQRRQTVLYSITFPHRSLQTKASQREACQ